MNPSDGDTTVTLAAETRADSGSEGCAQDTRSGVQPASQSRGSWGRLLGVDQAADYLSISRWSVYDLIKSGVLRVVRIPSVRADLGPRKTGNPKSRRRVLARPDFHQPLRKLLLDVRDLDRFVDGLPHELDPAAPRDTTP